MAEPVTTVSVASVCSYVLAVIKALALFNAPLNKVTGQDQATVGQMNSKGS